MQSIQPVEAVAKVVFELELQVYGSVPTVVSAFLSCVMLLEPD